MEKILKIDGKDVVFKSTAGTLLRYRNNFGTDMLKDVINLQKKLQKVKEDASEFDAVDLDTFAKLAWAMAKTANGRIPPIEQWLDNFETFSIYSILPDLLSLMTDNLKQQQQITKNV